MKVKISFLSALLTISLSAQSTLFMEVPKDAKNIIKTNVTAYVFRNLNLSYERVISDKFSLLASVGYIPKGPIPFINVVLDKGDDLRDLKMAHQSYTLEGRYYFNGGRGEGFYVAPYVRHSILEAPSHQFDFTLEDAVTGNQVVEMTFSGKANSINGGLMLGKQWFMGKNDNVIVDFWILGGHFGKGLGDFYARTSRPLTASEQQQAQQELEDLNVVFFKYTVKTHENGADIRLDGPWGGLRSGLSIGYRF